MELHTWLTDNYPTTNIEAKPPTELEANTWKEIRLFLSSTFVDTHAERDVIIKRVIPSVNRKLASRFIRVTPVDLRWGVLKEESKDCETIQKTCLNQLEKCRQEPGESPWFLGLRTQRYGWVQDKLAASEWFEKPEQCMWLDRFSECGKNVSITSLECIQASMPPKTRANAQTVFFYKRNIANPSEIEQDLRWVFDFEYIPEKAELDAEVQYQYTKTTNAITYEEDRDDLDTYLMESDNVKYSTFQCYYEKGGARFTCKNENKKSFGVGYVTELTQFQEQVERDLLNAIDENFKEADVSDMPEHVFDNTQHENSVKQKASTFIGRSELYDKCYQFCFSENVNNSVMIIHGQPGCGKSALLAAVAERCLGELRSNGDFMFVHAIDSCPGSNNIEGMLIRLQMNLRRYRIDLGEIDMSEECPKSAAVLKSGHVQFLEESATKYPEKKFVVLIDAVNQFQGHLQAWRMWWLPSADAPNNLRVVISTLNEENNTFENATKMCPNAVRVAVENMSYSDRQEMVTACLARYNKKLTTSDDERLGNQMEALLCKSESPLFLIAATEALRKFGIFEEVTRYIKKLPNSTSNLFSFLLDEWCEEYGGTFTKDITGFICVSKDGLLENQINDLLLFKESAEGVFYDCSFSRLYDSLSSFLASGGGGFLRFFHDQLKFEVKRKFLTPEVEEELHRWLVKFYLNCIQPQLRATPSVHPPAYYQHCLQQVVYHQLESTRTNKGKVDFTETLRNIYFVRERIRHQQEDWLRQDYVNAHQSTPDKNERTALKQWSKFISIYLPYIKSGNYCAHNMASNQIPTSHVTIDTNKLPEPTPDKGYPFYWINNTSSEDAMVLKYTSAASFICVASESKRNIVCIGGKEEVFIYEADSGILIDQVKLEGELKQLYLSSKCNTLWIGARNLTAWSIDSGGEEWRLDTDGDMVIWFECIGDNIACGTTTSLYIIDEKDRKVTKRWSIGTANHFYFHWIENVIFSIRLDYKSQYVNDGWGGYYDNSTNNIIKCWSMDGQMVRSTTDIREDFDQRDPLPSNDGNGLQWCLSSFPGKDKVAVVPKYYLEQLNYTTGEVIRDIPRRSRYKVDNYKVIDDNTSGRMLCVSFTKNTISVYDVDGNLQSELKGDFGHINHDVCLVPGTNDLLTAGNDGSMMFRIPTAPDHGDVVEGSSGQVIWWCEFLPGGEEFVTFSHTDLSIWNTSSLERSRSTQICKMEIATVHPAGSYIAMYSQHEVYWLSTENLETVATLSDTPWIRDVTISPDDTKCVVTTSHEGAVVFDITDINEMKRTVIYKAYGMSSSDIHRDNIRVVTAGRTSVDVWNLINGEKISTLSARKCDEGTSTAYVQICSDTDYVIYYRDLKSRRKSGDRDYYVMDMDGEDVSTIQTTRGTCLLEGSLTSALSYSSGSLNSKQPKRIFKLLRNGEHVLTAEEDKTIRLYALRTGELLYTFFVYDPQAQDFTCFAVHPSNSMVIAYNRNGKIYVLKTSRK